MGQTMATGGGPSRTADDSPYAALTPLSRRSLVDSFDHRRSLFSHQLLNDQWREIDEIYPHETLTSSCIALLGLARSGESFDQHAIDPERCLEAIAGEVRRTGYVGGIGLALWANAVVGGGTDAEAYLRSAGLSLGSVVDDLLPSLTTMEAAWLASGLLHDAARRDDAAVRRAAQSAVDELRTNRYSGATRLMRHAGAGASAVHRLRGHIANFADQIYSVQAFAFASIVLDDAAARGAGTALADHHVQLQGPLGQWWWHFDAQRGHVALRYAVYSVHQHGMSPMALAAIDTADGADRSAAIDASLAWISRNESGTSMVDEQRSTIWRSLERIEPVAAGRLRGVLEALGVADQRDADVSLNRETRPYEWAWCMYAAAIAAGAPKGGSIV